MVYFDFRGFLVYFDFRGVLVYFDLEIFCSTWRWDCVKSSIGGRKQGDWTRLGQEKRLSYLELYSWEPNTLDKSSTRSADLTKETRVVNSGLKASRSRMAHGLPEYHNSKS